MEDEKNFIKIMRKDKIDFNSFKNIEVEAKEKLKSLNNSDVLSLTITMNSPTMSLIDVEKVTPEVFNKLIKL